MKYQTPFQIWSRFATRKGSSTMKISPKAFCKLLAEAGLVEVHRGKLNLIVPDVVIEKHVAGMLFQIKADRIYQTPSKRFFRWLFRMPSRDEEFSKTLETT